MTMTQEQAVQELETIGRGGHTHSEEAHLHADRMILQFLRDNGFAQVADAWDAAQERVGFWYS